MIWSRTAVLTDASRRTWSAFQMDTWAVRHRKKDGRLACRMLERGLAGKYPHLDGDDDFNSALQAIMEEQRFMVWIEDLLPEDRRLRPHAAAQI